MSKALTLDERQPIGSRNIASFASVPEVKNAKCHIYERYEIINILEVATDKGMEAICGLRRGDILGLIYSDIYLTDNRIKIPRHLIPTK